MSDPAADIDELATAIYQAALEYCARVPVQQADAEEVANRVAFEVCKQPAFWLKSSTVLRAIVHTVTPRCIIDVQRDEKKHRHTSLKDVESVSLSSYPDETLELAELVLNHLVPDENSLLRLLRRCRTDTEIANELGIEEKTVTKRKERLLAKLRQLLGIDDTRRHAQLKSGRVPNEGGDEDTSVTGRHYVKPGTKTHEPAIALEESVVTRAVRILSDGPQPSDYLQPPAEVAAWVDQHLADTYTAKGTEIPTDERQWILANSSLHYLYAGREIACRRTEAGIIVFAVGAAEVSNFLRSVPVDRRPDVAVEYP